MTRLAIASILHLMLVFAAIVSAGNTTATFDGLLDDDAAALDDVATLRPADEDRASKAKWVCTQPASAVGSWYYKTEKTGPFVCTKKGDDKGEWAMLNAYRAGGEPDVHWKYTNKLNDPECLENWIYYASDGKKIYEYVKGRTTKYRDWLNKRWCALPVYRSKGKLGTQWQYCTCTKVQ